MSDERKAKLAVNSNFHSLWLYDKKLTTIDRRTCFGI